MRLGGKVILLTAAALVMWPASASAHRMSINDADRAVTKVIKLVAEGAGYDQAWADNCTRRTAHKVACTAFTKDWVPSLGAMAKCRRAAVAEYRNPGSEKVKVTLSNTVDCTYTYPQPDPECSDGIDNDQDGKADYPSDPDCTGPDDDDESSPLPAPETVLTEGPENGSVVEGTLFPDGRVLAFVHVGMSATGGVDPFFECSQDAGEFLFCGASETWTTTLMYEGTGPHTMAVRACSGWGTTKSVCDPTPETRSFQVSVP